MEKQIINCLLEKVISSKIDDIAIYPYTVYVESLNVGLASTMKASSCVNIAHMGRMHELPTGKLAELINSDITLEAAIGLAAINSSLNHQKLRNELEQTNAFQILLEKGQGKNVSIVGHFPFIDKLIKNKSCKNLWVFELNPKAETDLPPDLIPEYLPASDVVLVSGTTLINHTFDDIHRLFHNSYNIMLDPSTPLNPSLFDFGFDAVCGAVVTNKEKAKRCFSQGACYREAEGLEFATLRKKSAS